MTRMSGTIHVVLSAEEMERMQFLGSRGDSGLEKAECHAAKCARMYPGKRFFVLAVVACELVAPEVEG